MKKLPIGISNFKEMIEGGYYYVDKTLLIKEVLEAGKVVVMSRPRRFGKTLNLLGIDFIELLLFRKIYQLFDSIFFNT